METEYSQILKPITDIIKQRNEAMALLKWVYEVIPNHVLQRPYLHGNHMRTHIKRLIEANNIETGKVMISDDTYQFITEYASAMETKSKTKAGLTFYEKAMYKSAQELIKKAEGK